MNLETVRRKATNILESLHEDVCTVTEKIKKRDETTGKTTFSEENVLENIPCRLSFSSSPNNSTEQDVASVEQVIKLFVSPEIMINPGSKITVTHKGITTVYKASGQVANFYTHNEYVMNKWDGYA